MTTAQPLGRLAGAIVGVPDPAATAAFLRDGLRFAVSTEGPDVVVACAGDYGPRGQAAIVLRTASALELLEVTWEVAEAYDLDALEKRLEAASLSSAADGNGLAFADPSGTRHACVRAGALDRPSPPHDPVRPRRLGHVNLKVPDPSAAAAFYSDVLGLRLSEQIGDGLYFLRIATEHHNVGLRGGGERGELHHLGFEVEGWNVYQPILDHLAELDVQIEYGPGRHRPGNNIFAYLRDPSSGLRLELFADMAHIPDAASHVPARWEAGDRMTKTINRWGPTPPASFLE